jgi:hypothetical protein
MALARAEHICRMQDFPSGDDLTMRSALLSGTSAGSAINAEASTNTTEL